MEHGLDMMAFDVCVQNLWLVFRGRDRGWGEGEPVGTEGRGGGAGIEGIH